MMQRQYGSRLFKCNRFGCPYFRTGFETKPDRDRHLRVHDRPYKCDRPNCDFSDMGFGSQARLNVHLKYHEKQAKKPVAHLADIDDNEDVELIILDAVKADDVDLVRDFIADVPRFSRELLRKALVSCSCEMLDVLLKVCSNERNNGRQYEESTILDDAVGADNLEAVRMLLGRGASLKYKARSFLKFEGIFKATRNISPEMIKVLLSDRHIQELLAKNDWTTPSIHFLSLMRVEKSKEARFIQCLSLLPDWTTKKKTFISYFGANARGSCSIAIAEFLLRHGVDVNTRATTGNTALYRASRRKDQTGAEFMKFLLESGANPLAPASSKSQPIADRPGPRNISKWLGMSWEQLVEESRKKYNASLETGPQ